MIRLDAIFLALGIETEDDIFKLTQYFMRMKMPEDGEIAEEEAKEEKEDVGEEDAAGRRQQTPGNESLPESSSDFAGEEEDLLEEKDSARKEEEGDVVLDEDNAELVHPNDVLKAMKAFVESHPKFQQKTTSKSHSFQIAVLDERDDSEDTKYWHMYGNALSDTKKKTWDAMKEGMERYKQTLTQRSKLLTETDALRQQNAELRLLLQQYVHSKVNGELVIPPTRILQYDAK